MLQVNMTAALRKESGKGAARQLRMKGRTPAVLYGPKTEPLSLSLDTAAFTKELVNIHGHNAVIFLDIEGLSDKSKRNVIIKEIQKNPVQDTVVHADFCEISLDKPITLAVPINFIGKAKGVDMGGVLHITTHMVHLNGMPLEIPDQLEIDVTELVLGGPGLTCDSLVIPDNVSLQEELDQVCVTVVHPSAQATAEEEEGEEAAEEGAAEGAEEQPAESSEAEAEGA